LSNQRIHLSGTRIKMDILLKFVEVLAWPITILLLGLLFRHELRGIIRRLSHVKYKEWEANFQKDIREAEENAKKIPVIDKTSPKIAESSEYERILRLIEISPRSAVTEAWREVELATARAARSTGLNVEGQIAGTRHIYQLAQRNIIPEGIMPVYTQIRRLRNKIAHTFEFEIDSVEAERIVELALGIAAELNQVAEMSA